MADFSTTTPACVLKSASRSHSTLSPVAFRFRGVLHAIDDLIAAEYDLDGYSGQDPALDEWIRDAEIARQATLDTIKALHATPTLGHADAQLQRVARLFRMVMISDDPAQVTYIRARAAETERFLLPRGNPLHFKLNQLILGALGRLERYAALDDHKLDDPGHQVHAADVTPTPTI